MKILLRNLSLVLVHSIGMSTAGFGALVGQFTFENDSLTDTTGNWNDLELKGNASIINGQLDVNGSGTTATGWAATTGAGDYSGPALGDKTLVSWVALQDANVRAGSALTIDTRSGDVFDGIIWAEQTAGRWMNGSNGFVRTMDFGAGADEPGPFDGSNLIQMAISYEDLGGGNVQITGYRNGVQIGQYTDTPFATWSTPNVELILGKRHGNPNTGVPGALDALIEEVRIYDEVLDAAALDALLPVGSVDDDMDLLPDEWEQDVIDSDPNDAIDSLDDITADGNLDGDDLTNAEEFARGTDPLDEDSDDDTLLDHVEDKSGDFVDATNTGTDPNNPDTDGDNLRDDHETGTTVYNSPTDTGTDPNKRDTDGDKLDDDFEIAAPFTDPNDPNDPPAPPLDATLIGQWTFEEGLELVDLTGNWPDLELRGDAVVADGVLDVNGAGTTATGWAASGDGEFAGGDIGEKTLVSWLTVQSPSATAGAGSAITIDTKTGDIFDGIIFGERDANRWMNGSNGFSRTPDNGFTDGVETSTDGSELIMMAITHEDLGGGNVRITGYRNGVQIGQYDDSPFGTWSPANCEIIFGKRHGNPDSGVPGGLDALIEEARIYAQAATPTQILALFNQGPGGGGAKLPLEVTQAGGDLVFTWPSAAGKLYNLRSETDPASNDDPASWAIFEGNADIVATPPENTLSIPLPADPFRLFVIEEFDAPPASVFAENFDAAAAIPAGWVTGSNAADTGTTLWEFGAPSLVGPPAANSADNCAATNLSADYGFNTDIFLRTPPIDLTLAGDATLNFEQFVDIELQFDLGAVSILDANDGDAVIAVLESPIDGNVGSWELFSKALPPQVLGNVIKIEWSFSADEFGSFSGWYLDDVNVTVP